MIAGFVRMLGVTTTGGVGALPAVEAGPVSLVGRAHAVAMSSSEANRAPDAWNDADAPSGKRNTARPYCCRGGAGLPIPGCASTQRAGSKTSGAMGWFTRTLVYSSLKYARPFLSMSTSIAIGYPSKSV